MAARTGGGSKPLTKSQLLATLAKTTGLTKKQVQSVFIAFESEAKRSLSRHGVITLPASSGSLLKIKKVRTEAKPARTIMMFGKKTDVKAKPASTKVKVTLLKSGKELI